MPQTAVRLLKTTLHGYILDTQPLKLKGMVETETLDFSMRSVAAGGDGWPQGRYYYDDGVRVRELLSFEQVFEICPFEVGVDRRKEKRAHASRLKSICAPLELDPLMRRPFSSLSNGEMQRVLFARAYLRCPERLVLVDPFAGLDAGRRAAVGKLIDALVADGVKVRIRQSAGENDGRASSRSSPRRKAAAPATRTDTEPVVELRDVTVRFGRRVLFDSLSWTVRRGERWVLRGPNGSGKTTLFALITGDCPAAYANDVRVFGIRREVGVPLDTVRRRIAMVSPEQQMYSGVSPTRLVEDALRREPELLLLDEPCMNLSDAGARRLLRRIASWLETRPSVTAICIAHRAIHVPPGFLLEKRI